MTIKNQKNIFLPQQTIVFKFTGNTDPNKIKDHILFLLSRENESIQKITGSAGFLFSRKLLSNNPL